MSNESIAETLAIVERGVERFNKTTKAYARMRAEMRANGLMRTDRPEKVVASVNRTEAEKRALCQKAEAMFADGVSVHGAEVALCLPQHALRPWLRELGFHVPPAKSRQFIFTPAMFGVTKRAKAECRTWKQIAGELKVHPTTLKKHHLAAIEREKEEP